jgi:hypothetical protein
VFRLLLKLALLGSTGIVMIAVNRFVDPALFFGAGYADPAGRGYQGEILNDMRAGRTHALRFPYQERAFYDSLAADHPQIDVLCLGSSVAKPIHKELYPGRRFLNAAVYGGFHLETMIAAYQIFVERGVRPKTVVLVIDPSCFHNQKRLAVGDFAEDLRRALQRLGLAPAGAETRGAAAQAIASLLGNADRDSDFVDTVGPFHPYDKLISPRYFQLSITLIARDLTVRARGEKAKRAGGGVPEEARHTALPDGSVAWCTDWSRRTPAMIRDKWGAIVQDPEAYQKPLMDKARCRDFEAFVANLLHTHTRVEIVLPPQNPWFYAESQKVAKRLGKPYQIPQVEAYVRSVAEHFGVPVRGSYDAARVGFHESDFVDYAHIRREAIDALWTRSPSDAVTTRPAHLEHHPKTSPRPEFWGR